MYSFFADCYIYVYVLDINLHRMLFVVSLTEAYENGLVKYR